MKTLIKCVCFSPVSLCQFNFQTQQRTLKRARKTFSSLFSSCIPLNLTSCQNKIASIARNNYQGNTLTIQLFKCEQKYVKRNTSLLKWVQCSWSEEVYTPYYLAFYPEVNQEMTSPDHGPRERSETPSKPN